MEHPQSNFRTRNREPGKGKQWSRETHHVMIGKERESLHPWVSAKSVVTGTETSLKKKQTNMCKEIHEARLYYVIKTPKYSYDNLQSAKIGSYLYILQSCDGPTRTTGLDRTVSGPLVPVRSGSNFMHPGPVRSGPVRD